MPLFKSLFFACGLAVLGALAVSNDAFADSPGLDAIHQFEEGYQQRDAIENRFFLKGQRFEVTPMFGYVPNNPFAKRFLGGVFVGYHFNEQFSAQATIAYAPDLEESDLKGLTSALVVIAHSGPGGANFQQPIDKLTLWAAFGGTWSPFYGKINLIGETVLNFDLYLSAGLGMISKVDYQAVYDDSAPNFVSLQGGTHQALFSPTAGIGTNFFINQFMALKIDSRFAFWVDKQPQYCAGADCQPVSGQRLYNNFVISGGLAFFFPNMKPRLYDF